MGEQKVMLRRTGAREESMKSAMAHEGERVYGGKDLLRFKPRVEE